MMSMLDKAMMITGHKAMVGKALPGDSVLMLKSRPMMMMLLAPVALCALCLSPGGIEQVLLSRLFGEPLHPLRTAYKEVST